MQRTDLATPSSHTDEYADSAGRPRSGLFFLRKFKNRRRRARDFEKVSKRTKQRRKETLRSDFNPLALVPSSSPPIIVVTDGARVYSLRTRTSAIKEGVVHSFYIAL